MYESLQIYISNDWNPFCLNSQFSKGNSHLKHTFKVHDLVIIRDHTPTVTGTSSSFNLKMNTDIYTVTEGKEGSRSITVKDIHTLKEKNVNAEDIQIVPLNDYFFSTKRQCIDRQVMKEVNKLNDYEENELVDPKIATVEPIAKRLRSKSK